MRRYICYLTAILLLLAACKGEEDIRGRARKELTKTTMRYAHNAQDQIISNVNEIFHCEQGCIFNFTGSGVPFLPIFRRAGFYKGWQYVDDDPMRKSI